jgi:hypothetical protein
MFEEGNRVLDKAMLERMLEADFEARTPSGGRQMVDSAEKRSPWVWTGLNREVGQH